MNCKIIKKQYYYSHVKCKVNFIKSYNFLIERIFLVTSTLRIITLLFYIFDTSAYHKLDQFLIIKQVFKVFALLRLIYLNLWNFYMYNVFYTLISHLSQFWICVWDRFYVEAYLLRAFFLWLTLILITTNFLCSFSHKQLVICFLLWTQSYYIIIFT